MNRPWLDVESGGSRERNELTRDRTRVGGAGCDVVLAAVPAGDELHVWTHPPKVVFVGAGSRPLLNGRACEEASLADGDTVQWAGSVLVFHAPDLLEELPVETEAARSGAPAPAAPALPADPGSIGRLTQRVYAGLLAESGRTDRATIKRWRDAVLRGEFDPDACARELIAGAQAAPEDPALVERAGRLQRDLLMTALQSGVRGATRRARVASKRGLAWVVANFIAIGVYTLVLVAIVLLVRVQYDFSVDDTVDGILELVTPADPTPEDVTPP